MDQLHVEFSMNRRGMTLTEMLVATTMTLCIMGVVVQLFGMVGNGVSASRASLRMSSELRSVAHALRTDLNGITVETVPPVKVGSDSGYLEIIEGSETDTSLGLTQLTGDIDDVLMFTTQSLGKPFVGKLGTAGPSIESPYAEVAWFCRSTSRTVGGSTLYNLHRRQLLAMDYVGAGDFHIEPPAVTNSMSGNLVSDFTDYDLSLRQVGGDVFPNGLSDLTKRENRFLHGASFPFVVDDLSNSSDSALSGSRIGEDIMLSNVLAFDVRVFDPDASVRDSGSGVALIPGDPGYSTSLSILTSGAYIDMGVTGAGKFASMHTGSQLSTLSTYDTWSDHYEFNGIDEDSRYGVDQKNNMIDDDSNGIIDDANELETSPPYPVPLRGLEVRVRIYDTSTRQVRQMTVRHTFVPH